ncbi:MAG: hypothetical protein A2Z18_03565 [Armatimonadetes bacterium RBG_16_58_9]|nr:MAG: hypothetical protein A2Z18_03565 [Armatimonadetes bacterium RBG_16_58_9]
MAKSNVVRIAALTPLGQDLGEAVNAFLSCCRSKNLSPNTIIYYENRLKAFRRYLQARIPR